MHKTKTYRHLTLTADYSCLQDPTLDTTGIKVGGGRVLYATHKGTVRLVVEGTVESNSAYGTEKLISLVISLVASLQQTAWHCSSLFFFSYRRKLFFLVRTSRDIEREDQDRQG